MRFKIVIYLICLSFFITLAYPPIARLKYESGGDWYNDPEILPNLIRFLNENYSKNSFEVGNYVVSATSPEIFNFPILFLTGHGDMYFTNDEIVMLRKYLDDGGVIYIDDDYGLDRYVKQFIKQLYPNKKLEKLPKNHRIFNVYYNFDYLPKIHDHYPSKEAEILGIKDKDRWTIIYTYNTNISDGWTGAHNDSREKQLEALKFGVNILLWALTD